MSIFETFASLCGDFDMCKLAFKRSHEAAKDICAAVRYRLETEDAQIDERILELERRQNDPGCNATVRRMIDLELEQLRNRTAPAPTPEEIDAFQQEIATAEDAIRDMRALKRKTREAIDAINAEVARLRGETLGSDVDLISTWIERLQHDFARLGGG